MSSVRYDVFRAFLMNRCWSSSFVVGRYGGDRDGQTRLLSDTRFESRGTYRMWILGQALRHKVFKSQGERTLKNGGLRLRDQEQHSHWVVLRQRRLALRHLYRSDAQTPDISLCIVVRYWLGHLRSLSVRRAYKCVALGLRSNKQRGDTKIAEHDPSRRRY